MIPDILAQATERLGLPPTIMEVTVGRVGLGLALEAQLKTW